MAAPIADDADFDTLFGAWVSATADFIELVTPLSQQEWDASSGLPGWSIGDVVAHVSWIESVLIGEYDEPHEPDWDSLPHAVSFFQKATEIPVDLRRSWPREAVLVELADVTRRREQALLQSSHDVNEMVTGILGEAPLGTVLRMRTMDTWVHEQDIRAALGRPGHLDSLGAQATASQLLPGYAKVWGKLCGAQAGEVLRLRVSEPGISFSRDVIIGDDGRAKVVAEQSAPVTVTLTMDWPTFLNLSCGRGDAREHRKRVTVEGDQMRAGVVLDNFCVMI